MAVTSTGIVVISDTTNCKIRALVPTTGSDPSGSGSSSDSSYTMTTLVGTGVGAWGGDGGPPAAAEINNPYRVAVDAADNVYIADYSNHR